MQLQIIEDDVELNDKTRKFIETRIIDKFSKVLSNFNSDLLKGDMRISRRSRWGYKVNFDMILPGQVHIYAEEVHNDLLAAINIVKEEALRQIKRYKEKLEK